MEDHFTSNPPVNMNEAETVEHYMHKINNSQDTPSFKDQVAPLPSTFEQFNKVDKVNLSNPDYLDSLAFKMAVWDVLENTKNYRSAHCAHDLYYTGHNWSEIPEETRDRLQLKFIASYRYMRDLMARMAEKSQQSEAQDPAEALLKEAEERLGMRFNDAEKSRGN